MCTKLWLAIVAVAFFWACGRTSAQQPSPESVADDEKLLKNAGWPVDGKGVLEYLRRQVPGAEDMKKVDSLFRQLGSDNFKERQKASADLIAEGPKIVPILRRLLEPAQPLEVRMRAERCMQAVANQSPAAVISTALRLIKARPPAGACAAILEFAAFAPDEAVFEDTLECLHAIGVDKGKVDAALHAALKDAQPARRQLAAVLVGGFGSPAQRQDVGALLDDKDAAVRFRAAQGLAVAGQRQALPVLVESLRQAPPTLAERAEELLLQVAGPTAPKLGWKADEASHAKVYDAWSAWLKTHQKTVDLSKIEIGLPLGNPTLRARDVVQQLFDSMLKRDLEKVRRLTELPFYMAGQKTLTTQQEWDEDLKQNQPPPPNVKFTTKVDKAMTLDEYFQNPRVNQADKNFLAKYPRSQVRVVMVLLSVDLGGNSAAIGMNFYVRASGGGARVFGIAMPDVFAK